MAIEKKRAIVSPRHGKFLTITAILQLGFQAACKNVPLCTEEKESLSNLVINKNKIWLSLACTSFDNRETTPH
jgi:hypothetical protein